MSDEKPNWLWQAGFDVGQLRVKELETENEQLRADLKQCAEALEYAGSHEHEGFDESNSHYNQSCSVCQKIDNALSLPSVQNALNGK